VEGISTNEGAEEVCPLKKRYSTVIGWSNAKLVADTHRHAAYHEKHWRRDS